MVSDGFCCRSPASNFPLLLIFSTEENSQLCKERCQILLPQIHLDASVIVDPNVSDELAIGLIAPPTSSGPRHLNSSDHLSMKDAQFPSRLQVICQMTCPPVVEIAALQFLKVQPSTKDIGIPARLPGAQLRQDIQDIAPLSLKEFGSISPGSHLRLAGLDPLSPKD